MRILIGNIFDSKAKTLVNTVNCVGVMGKGIAAEFKKRYPRMFDEYAEKCKNSEIKPGKPFYYCDSVGNSILNFPTKEHWRSPSKLSYIIDGLDWFVNNYKNLEIDSIAFPPLGCGNGGLPWKVVGPIMYNKLKDLPIKIEIYAPYGTNPDYLKIDFLERTYNNKEVLGESFKRIRKEWYLLLHVVEELNNTRYSLHVGRTIFQKICFVMTRMGLNTEFKFIKGNYGPYCPEIKKAMTILSNSNLIQEQCYGKMIEIKVTDTFKFNQAMFSKRDLSIANATIDLFSRIKDIEQAEVITTVLFAYDSVVKNMNNQKPMDYIVYDFVMDWKKHWTSVKSEEVCDAIQNLTALNLMDVAYSGKVKYNFEI